MKTTLGIALSTLLLITGLACSDDDTPADAGAADKAVADDGKKAGDTGPTRDTGPAKDKGPAKDTGPTADTGPTKDSAPTPDATPGKESFQFLGANYPLVKAGVFCSSVAGIYTIRGGSKKNGTGAQANIYAYFPGKTPPAAGSYKLIGYGLTSPAAGEARVMVVDFTDSAMWWSKAGTGTVKVTLSGTKRIVSFSGLTVEKQIKPGTTSKVSCLMSCTPKP